MLLGSLVGEGEGEGEGLPYQSLKLLFNYLNACDHNPSSLQTDRQTDGRTDDCDDILSAVKTIIILDKNYA